MNKPLEMTRFIQDFFDTLRINTKASEKAAKTPWSLARN